VALRVRQHHGGKSEHPLPRSGISKHQPLNHSHSTWHLNSSSCDLASALSFSPLMLCAERRVPVERSAAGYRRVERGPVRGRGPQLRLQGPGHVRVQQPRAVRPPLGRALLLRRGILGKSRLKAPRCFKIVMASSLHTKFSRSLAHIVRCWLLMSRRCSWPSSSASTRLPWGTSGARTSGTVSTRACKQAAMVATRQLFTNGLPSEKCARGVA